MSVLVNSRIRVDSGVGPDRYWFQPWPVKLWRWTLVIVWMVLYPVWLVRAWAWYHERTRRLEWALWSPGKAFELARSHFLRESFTMEELCWDVIYWELP